MGLIRSLLALCVVFGHMDVSHFLPGSMAVQAFYVISGFYMSLVLDGKYPPTRAGTLLFYSNRYLRLAPIYWLVASVTLVATLAWSRPDSPSLADFGSLSIGARVLLAAVNLLIVGQDVTMFLAVGADRALHFTANYAAAHTPAHRFLLVPQAWTVGVELTFYLIAPFLLRVRTRYIVLAVLASIALRAALASAGLRHDPWSYRFFPTELAFFLSGKLVYDAYRRFPRVAATRWYQWSATFVVLAWALGYSHIWTHGPTAAKALAFYATLVCALPGIFALTKRSKRDREIGELSYPIYIVHHLVVTYLQGRLGPVATAIIVVGVAFFLYRLVEAPFDRWRQRRVATATSG